MDEKPLPAAEVDVEDTVMPEAAMPGSADAGTIEHVADPSAVKELLLGPGPAPAAVRTYHTDLAQLTRDDLVRLVATAESGGSSHRSTEPAIRVVWGNMSSTLVERAEQLTELQNLAHVHLVDAIWQYADGSILSFEIHLGELELLVRPGPQYSVAQKRFEETQNLLSTVEAPRHQRRPTVVRVLFVLAPAGLGTSLGLALSPIVLSPAGLDTQLPGPYVVVMYLLMVPAVVTSTRDLWRTRQLRRKVRQDPHWLVLKYSKRQPKMTKSEVLMAVLTVLTLVVALCAWLFPRS